jgi:hypothetical protein
MTRLCLTFGAGAGVVAAFLAAGVARSPASAGAAYAGTTWAATLAMLAAAVALFAAAPAARTPMLGILALCAGLCWIAPTVAAWPTGPPALGASSTLLAAFTLPLLAHLALGAPTGRLDGAVARLVVSAAYAWATLAAITLALVRDPFYDPSCWSGCEGNAFLVVSSPGLTTAVEDIRPWIELGLGIAILVAGIRALRGSGAGGRVSGVAAAAVGAVAGLHALRVLGTPYEDPLDPEFRGVFFGACAAAVLVSVAVATPSALVALRRRAVVGYRSLSGRSTPAVRRARCPWPPAAGW